MEKLNPDDNAHLYHGSEWVQYEDRSVGNKEGLKLLKSHIDEAINNGEVDIVIGEFMGIVCVEDNFFNKCEKEQESKMNRIFGYVFFSIIFLIIISALIGIYTIGKWIYSLF